MWDSKYLGIMASGRLVAQPSSWRRSVRRIRINEFPAWRSSQVSATSNNSVVAASTVIVAIPFSIASPVVRSISVSLAAFISAYSRDMMRWLPRPAARVRVSISTLLASRSA